jgi:hypothetical protein
LVNLRALLENSSDADFLRKMIGFAAQRLMELEVEGLTGAAEPVVTFHPRGASQPKFPAVLKTSPLADAGRAASHNAATAAAGVALGQPACGTTPVAVYASCCVSVGKNTIN